MSTPSPTSDPKDSSKAVLAVRAETTSPRGSASRIIPVERKNIFLTLTVVFVFFNVIPIIWANLAVLGLYGVFFVMVLIHSRNRRKIPTWLRGTADDVLERLRENPFELLNIVGVAILTFLKNVTLNDATPAQSALRELCSLVLITAAFYLSSRTRVMRGDRKRETSARTLMMRLMGKTGKVEKSNSPREALQPTVEFEGHDEDARSVMTEDGLTDLKRHMDVWEARQRDRWHEWIEQELVRLNEDSSTD